MRVLELPEHALYAITTNADVATLARCSDETLLEKPVDGDPQWGELPPVTDIAPGGLTISLPGGETTSLELAPGRYELTLLGQEGQPVGVDVSVELGP
ncbi:hypothetical protein PPSIR1_28213 [Plesiocystis pacifica SIR-1]|uniref:Uncharacterized protein n=1 Tax=Plesiocystis pacifica SIR-1 TaxID=391625 RepID=A6FZR5_9BACT|nr:hypothetical protein [Plesiocystis pacifica]EDM80871.1 hypothetical protein PPSIR1_28213 [Plesiocystis pacifica SIR-1]